MSNPMTEGERQILNEIGSLRREVNDGFRETRQNLNRAHKRIDETDKDVAEVKQKVAVNGTKIGIFMVFVTAIGHAISSWAKSKF